MLWEAKLELIVIGTWQVLSKYSFGRDRRKCVGSVLHYKNQRLTLPTLYLERREIGWKLNQISEAGFCYLFLKQDFAKISLRSEKNKLPSHIKTHPIYWPVFIKRADDVTIPKKKGNFPRRTKTNFCGKYVGYDFKTTGKIIDWSSLNESIGYNFLKKNIFIMVFWRLKKSREISVGLFIQRAS